MGGGNGEEGSRRDEDGERIIVIVEKARVCRAMSRERT